jgi:hypothetical protein
MSLILKSQISEYIGIKKPYEIIQILMKKGYKETAIKFVLRFHYDIIFTNMEYELHDKRYGQQNYREDIVKRDICCVVTGYDKDSCECAHIVEYNECKTFDADNGILLHAGLHKSFDHNYWCINPITCRIEISDTIKGKNFLINEYKDKYIVLNNNTKEFLKMRYRKFKK